MEKQKYANAQQILDRFGLRQGQLITLAKEGKIKAIRVKRDPKMKRGSILYVVATIEAYIESMAEAV